MTADSTALFVWLYQAYRVNEQDGIECAVYRNEGEELSSELILEAELIAWNRWPGARLFTYVDPGAVESANPGFCFKAAGWSCCGETGRGLHVLEKLYVTR
jgi:hypothetical protein